jgi:hypothetical protein
MAKTAAQIAIKLRKLADALDALDVIDKKKSPSPVVEALPHIDASPAKRGGSQAFLRAVPGKRFLSEIEAESSYGIPHRTLQNWRVLGRGPLYRKFGKAVKYDVADLEAWIQGTPTGGAGVPSSAVKGGR